MSGLTPATARSGLLRETFSASTKKLLLEKSMSSGKPTDLDQDDTVKTRYSPGRAQLKKQSPEPGRLRSTYSPATFSTKYLGDPLSKMQPAALPAWKTAARISSYSPKNPIRRPSEVLSAGQGLSKIESQLSTLEQRVNRAIKELNCKNTRKPLPTQLKSISQDTQAQYQSNGTELGRTRSRQDLRTVQQSVRQSSNGKQKQQIDLKATIKIPELSKLVSTVPKPKEAVGFTTNPYSPRSHNIYYVSELIRAIGQPNALAKEHVKSAIRILKILENADRPTVDELDHRRLELSRREFYRDKKTLVFDLDQTLIHCNESPTIPSDIKLTIKMQTGEVFEAGINIRPYALTLLNNLVNRFQLILFTASHSSYANVVLDYIDPDRKLFQHRLYRQHCYMTESGVYVKDLRVINRNLHDMVLIDNAAYSYAFQLENGVPILSYYEGQDFQLKALERYLDKLTSCKDVRELNRHTFKLHHYTKFDTPEELIEQLYMDN